MKRVLLVEGESDAAALRAAAGAIDLVIGPIAHILVLEGATNVAHAKIPAHTTHVAALVDHAEVEMVRRRLGHAGWSDAPLFVCVEDLEDELIRAAGLDRAVEVVESEHDLRAFRALQHQVAWRGEPEHQQLRRFLASGSGRKARYAAALAAATSPERTAAPLAAALRWLATPTSRERSH